MTKSMIRIELRKPQSERHVCPTSRRPIVFRMKHEGNSKQILHATTNWLSKLVDRCVGDSLGADAWHGSHRCTLTVRVSSDDGCDVESVLLAELNCSAVVLLSRNLSRFEREVSRLWLLKAYPDWDLVPYAFEFSYIPENPDAMTTVKHVLPCSWFPALRRWTAKNMEATTPPEVQ